MVEYTITEDMAGLHFYFESKITPLPRSACLTEVGFMQPVSVQSELRAG